jgi:aminoglycoside phosphotransferase (APT) family kinase protein
MLNQPPFLPLIDHLAANRAPDDGMWRDWRVSQVGGAGNNLLYHATNHAHDLAIKFAIRDERDRAGREYAALHALQQAGLPIAPMPLWLDRDRYAQPVVAQTWLAGDVLAAPPSGEIEWRQLLDHYLTIHTLTPASVNISLQPAVMNMHSATDGLRRIRQQLAYIPEAERPAELRELMRNVEQRPLPDWPAPAFALCRVDANTLNFVRRPGGWASVDWENSGWGDPAFEIVDMITHPAYAGVPADRWEWLIDAYCQRCGEPGAAARIRVYHLLMLVWWVARLARMLYELPRGGDQRLATRPPGWMADLRAKYRRYFELAWAAAV